MENNTELLEISKALVTLSVYFIILPIAVGFIRIQKIEKHMKWLLGFLCVSALVEVAAYIMMQNGINNLFLGHVYGLFEFGSLLMVYRMEKNQVITKPWAIGLFVFLMCLATAEAFWWSSWKNFNSYTRASEALLLLGVAIRFYYVHMKRMEVERIERNAMFWVNTGVLFYYAGNLFTFAYTKLLESYVYDFHIMWGLHCVINIVMLLMFTTALIWSRKE